MQEPEEVKPVQSEVSQPDQSGLLEDTSSFSQAGHLKDHIDMVIEEWKKERPDLAIEPIGIINRLERLQTYMRAEVVEVFASFGLTGPSFAVMATLRRSGKPYQLSQRALVEALHLTGGTISVRIDRLERDGIVERLPDPQDQRGVLVRLTATGEQLFDRVAPLHLANEDRLLSALNVEQRVQLANLLRVLLLSFDAPDQEDLLHPLHWFGAALSPAHSARKMRHFSGLPDIPGLLIQQVAPGGISDKAGLSTGDLIIEANGSKVRSVEQLYQQFLTGQLLLKILRGVDERKVLIQTESF